MRRATAEWAIRQSRISRIRTKRERSRKVARRLRKLGIERYRFRRKVQSAQYQIGFDPDLTRTQIVLPPVFSFSSNYAQTADVLEAMRQAGLREGRRMMLHFELVEQIDPAAALVLVAEIYRIRKLRSNRAVTGTYPRSRAIYDLLSELGFFGLLNITEAYGQPKPSYDPGKPIFLKFISNDEVMSEGVDLFVTLIEKSLIPLNVVARGKLVAAIIEAMANTLDHAHPARIAGETMKRWWMTAKINMHEREVTIILFDQGVGIPATIDPTVYERLRALLRGLLPFQVLTANPSDGELIMAATELYRTGTNQPGRGKGFRNMKQFVDICTDGELRVLSNRGRYAYIAGTETCGNESLSISGTLIEWRFRHEGSVDMQDD